MGHVPLTCARRPEGSILVGRRRWADPPGGTPGEGLPSGLASSTPPPKPQRTLSGSGGRNLFAAEGVIGAGDKTGIFSPLPGRARLPAVADPQNAPDVPRSDLPDRIGGPRLDDMAMLRMHEQHTRPPRHVHVPETGHGMALLYRGWLAR
ncbi:hypothetical protein Ppa06_59730 [Planomonospora parontospora subsp. parontospora]|uniref:Uncharacterized protein n=2 Tax=Planomonospora parontospora TaxID=58119 RepID=A0AA37BM55_9ACTN|nr:hypothetical protein GCM10010126_59220 [Planomonospora parontospora]GII12175.1 hypothetical protein Ppa06_59730 [Planomonospora parontospora subsp. parontospora]